MDIEQQISGTVEHVGRIIGARMRTLNSRPGDVLEVVVPRDTEPEDAAQLLEILRDPSREAQLVPVVVSEDVRLRLRGDQVGEVIAMLVETALCHDTARWRDAAQHVRRALRLAYGLQAQCGGVQLLGADDAPDDEYQVAVSAVQYLDRTVTELGADPALFELHRLESGRWFARTIDEQWSEKCAGGYGTPMQAVLGLLEDLQHCAAEAREHGCMPARTAAALIMYPDATLASVAQEGK